MVAVLYFCVAGVLANLAEMPEATQCCADHGEKGANEAWHSFTELSLIAFTRHYYKAVASIVEQVEQDIFGKEASLKESTMKALNECLHI